MKAKFLNTINEFFQAKSIWEIRNNSMYNLKTKNHESNRR